MTGGNFLAYSCAAARDSHPLPSPLCEEDARTKGMLGKNENNAEKSNRRGGGCQVSRVKCFISSWLRFSVSNPDEEVTERNPLPSRRILRCAQWSARIGGGAFAWVLVSWFSGQS